MWDATCPDTLVPSYTSLAMREAEAVANEAEKNKRAKYSHLEASHHFVPVAVKSLGVFGSEAQHFFRDLVGKSRTPPLNPFHATTLFNRLP